MITKSHGADMIYMIYIHSPRIILVRVRGSIKPEHPIGFDGRITGPHRDIELLKLGSQAAPERV